MTKTDNTILESLDFDEEIPCDFDDGGIAVWFATNVCCGKQRMVCDQSKTKHERFIDWCTQNKAVHECKDCGAPCAPEVSNVDFRPI